jgi:hypothetical protein
MDGKNGVVGEAIVGAEIFKLIAIVTAQSHVCGKP